MVRFETPYNTGGMPPHHDSVSSEKAANTHGARKWNSWWSRRSPNIKTNDAPPICIGIDAGSKTLKLVTLDADGEIVHGLYHRHRSDVRTSLAELIHDVIWRYGDMELPCAVTGSAGIAIAESLGLPFVQEVIATSTAVRLRYPQADCIVELGGEDAKITYLTGTPEQRMNATCAGGTGDFIDGIASMLGCKTREISKLALGSSRTYPIASRCAVFAQTDVRPLINAGVPKADIAQSALEAVVNQTLGGLACGRPIRGNVVFLGGPLEHIPALLMTFKRKLGLSASQCIKPPDAHLFTAMGAVLTAENPPLTRLSKLEKRLRELPADASETGSFEPLFANGEELAAFASRHAGHRVIEKRLENATGPLYLGFDAGSTTMKYAVIDQHGALIASDYRTVDGDTFKTAQSMLAELLSGMEGRGNGQGSFIARAVVTGYGEDLLKSAFGFDGGIVETIAHLKAARHFYPDVSFMLDIGGQDMKALWVRDGVVVDAALNEACSSGCGAFIASCAKSLALTHEDFSQQALESAHPIDLGAKCTVFMTSRLRHAQKTGTPTGDIAAGAAYSIANNVVSRLIGNGHADTLGGTVVVQGGTFKSDAVLRAFEKVAGVEAIRPNIAHLMGAFGAALAALDGEDDGIGNGGGDASGVSNLLDSRTIAKLAPARSSARCPGCGNHCLLSIIDFGDGRRSISGNRCERATSALFGGNAPAAHRAPNVVALEQKLVASYGDVDKGTFSIGIMNTLNAYESIPFWHTLFAKLGFSVRLPNDYQAASQTDRARETIPSESACYPAKLSHMRYYSLIDAGCDTVFMPRFERGSRCPVSSLYADALSSNVERPRIASPTFKSVRPRKLVCNDDDRKTLLNLVVSWNPDISQAEFDQAVGYALAAQESFEDTIERAAKQAMAWTQADANHRAVLLSARPYLIDQALLHGIDRELAQLGFAVIPPLGFKASSLRKPLWKPARNTVRLVEDTANNSQLEIIALRAFGCGYDAVSLDEARDLAYELHRPFTELKIDEIVDTAHVRIRLRTLAHTTHMQKAASVNGVSTQCNSITYDLCSTVKELVALAVEQLTATCQSPDAERPLAQPSNPPTYIPPDSTSGKSSLVHLPQTCLDCLDDALPFELRHLGYPIADIEETTAAQPCISCGNGMKVGLIGNPLLVFNPAMNEHVEDLLGELGCTVVYPDPALVAIEDVRYLDQLERFREQGVQRVIYLQSFGCLKGHVQSRGAAREIARRFADLSVTIIDYDPESSSLNRENRIRLAVSAPARPDARRTDDRQAD